MNGLFSPGFSSPVRRRLTQTQLLPQGILVDLLRGLDDLTFHNTVRRCAAHVELPARRLGMPQRAQVQHVVYYEQVDIVIKPLSLDETVRKIRYALRQKQLRQAEEDFRRLKQEALRIFLS